MVVCTALHSVTSLSAQQNVGFGTFTPDPSALLDLTSTDRGLLIPRLSTAERDLIANPADWLLIFNTSSEQFQYYNGVVWIGLSTTATVSNAWSLTGNSLTTPATNFLGTTDNQPLHLRINNVTTAIFNVNGSIQRTNTGDARGINAVDLQLSLTAAFQVAGGTNSVLTGGRANTASGNYSVVSGGENNAAVGNYSAIAGGQGLSVGPNSFGFNATSASVDLSSLSNTAYLGDVHLWLGNNDNSAREIRLFEPTNAVATAQYSAFRAQSQSANILYTLPSAAPTTTLQVLGVQSIGGDILLQWTTPTFSVPNSWNLAGNTINNGDFLGTLNAEDLAFRVNNGEVMRFSTSGSVGIGTNSPSTSALLELSANDGGVLLPRLTTAERNAIGTPSDWLLIFNTTTEQFEFFNGASWIGLATTATAASAWALTGNAGTSPAANFIGTTDNQPFQVRVNNTTSAIFNINGSFQRTDIGIARGQNAVDLQFSLTANDQVASGVGAVLTGGQSNEASGQFSVVSGGQSNIAGGNVSVVAGGGRNETVGDFSAIPGGRDLTLGSNSFGFNATLSKVDLSGFSNIAYFGNVDLWLGRTDNIASEFRLFEPTGNVTTAQYSAFRAQTQSANILYTLPSVAPATTAQVLGVQSIGADIMLHWTTPTFSVADAWSLSGNSIANGDFLGTLNAEDLAFRTNNTEHMRLTTSGNVGVGTATPDASAQLELNSTTSGFLMPRMTEAQRDAIPNPAEGLSVYVTDGALPGINYFDGTQWVRLVIPDGIGSVVVRSKTVDESLANSTTLQDDDDLTITLGANQTWVIDGYLHVETTSNQPDFKFAFTVPGGATFNAGFHVNENATNILAGALNTSGVSQTVNLTSNAPSILVYKIMIQMGGTAGDFTIQWAQDNSNSTAINVLTGSFFMASRVN